MFSPQVPEVVSCCQQEWEQVQSMGRGVGERAGLLEECFVLAFLIEMSPGICCEDAPETMMETRLLRCACASAGQEPAILCAHWCSDQTH